jgi:hypothetical protein
LSVFAQSAGAIPAFNALEELLAENKLTNAQLKQLVLASPYIKLREAALLAWPLHWLRDLMSKEPRLSYDPFARYWEQNISFDNAAEAKKGQPIPQEVILRLFGIGTQYTPTKEQVVGSANYRLKTIWRIFTAGTNLKKVTILQAKGAKGKDNVVSNIWINIFEMALKFAGSNVQKIVSKSVPHNFLIRGHQQVVDVLSANERQI